MILFIGDPHYKKTNAYYTDIVEKEIDKILQRYKINLIVVLGDVLHNHGTLFQTALKRAVDWLFKLANNYRVICLIGNHDRVNEKIFCTNEHAFYGIEHENLEFIYKPTIIEHENKKFLACPYVEKGRFDESINTYINKEDLQNISLIFAHQEFIGSNMSVHKISEDGDNREKSNVWVVSGHIHKRHILEDIKVKYVGSTLQNDISEDPDRYVSIWNGKEFDDIIMNIPAIKKIEIFDIKKTREIIKNIPKYYLENEHLNIYIYFFLKEEEKSLIKNNSSLNKLKEKYDKRVHIKIDYIKVFKKYDKELMSYSDKLSHEKKTNKDFNKGYILMNKKYEKSLIS